ncbi:MAG: hypothetical protein ACREYC_24140 [Gammaproteobacteria bacterium]
MAGKSRIHLPDVLYTPRCAATVAKIVFERELKAGLDFIATQKP